MNRPEEGPPPIRYHPPVEIVVDGETFVIRKRTDAPGTYDFDWVSGPNEGYGFSSAGSQQSEAGLVEWIRQFLDMIDPATGYIEDD